MAWAEKLPSGRWRAAYRLPDGSKRSAGTFTHKKLALNAGSAAEQAATSLGWRDPRAAMRTWGEWCAEWWATRAVEPGTLKRDASRRDSRLLPRWADVPLIDITRQDVRAWAAQLTADGLAASTVERCVSLLSASFAAAIDAEIITANPAARLKLPKPDNTRERYLTKPEAHALIDAAPDGVHRAIVALLFGTGLRWGEAAGLQVGRVDLAGARLRVVETWDDLNNRLKEYPKSRRRRTVPIPPWVAEHLEPLLVGDGHVFTTNGVPLDYHNFLGRVWAKSLKAADLSDLKIHDARHTYASWLIQDGIPLEEVGRLLGHVSPLTTRRYAHLAEMRDDQVQSALAAPLRGADVGQNAAPMDSNVLAFVSRSGRAKHA